MKWEWHDCLLFNILLLLLWRVMSNDTILFSSRVIDPLVDTATNIFWELYAVFLYL